jgi:nicotinamidase/pyrazinamidase
MKALIIVDVQNDFCEGGALEVAGSNSIFPFINELVKYEDFSKIFVTKDWHPAIHTSFAVNHGKKPFEMIVDGNGENEMLWPVHCVKYQKGA